MAYILLQDGSICWPSPGVDIQLEALKQGGVVIEGEPVFSPDFRSELFKLNSEFQADVDVLNRAFSIASLIGGTSQVTKQNNIRAQYVTRKANYSTDLAALMAQYEV